MKTNIKITLLLLPLLFQALSWGGIPLRQPQKVWFSLYAIEDYSHREVKLDNLPRSIAHKNRFYNELRDAILKKYPNTDIKIRHNRENSSATVNNFLKDDLSQSEFVFFSGHGNQMQLSFYDKSLKFDVGTKSFTQDTKWVIIDACLFLNINKNLSDDPRKKETKIDENLKKTLLSLFKGVHAIMGNHAEAWQGTAKKHWYSSARWRTEDIYTYFAKYFITDGDVLADAYFSAAYKSAHNYIDNHAVGESTRWTGLMSAIAYFYGEFASGAIWDMSVERYGTTVNAPMVSSTANFNKVAIKMVFYKAGKPMY